MTQVSLLSVPLIQRSNEQSYRNRRTDLLQFIEPLSDWSLHLLLYLSSEQLQPLRCHHLVHTDTHVLFRKSQFKNLNRILDHNRNCPILWICQRNQTLPTSEVWPQSNNRRLHHSCKLCGVRLSPFQVWFTCSRSSSSSLVLSSRSPRSSANSSCSFSCCVCLSLSRRFSSPCAWVNSSCKLQEKIPGRNGRLWKMSCHTTILVKGNLQIT